MLHSRLRSKAQTSPPQSNISSPIYYEFPLSQQLNSSYHPNYKKLSSYRKHYHLEKIDFGELLDFRRLQVLIEDSLKLRNQKCQLCESTYHERQMFALCLCQHRYCENCLIEYVNFRINAMEEIRCPDEGCEQRVSLQGEIYKNLPDMLKNKYKRAHLWRQTIANPDLKLCPHQLCQGQVDMKLLPPQCTTCRKYYCPECMNQKHQGNCDKQFQLKYKEWRRCPNCRMFINKSQGCNHITCRCHNQFCFVCLEKWDTTHYKCQEKEQMYYFDMEEVKHPMLIVALMVAFFPFLVLFAVLAIAVSFGFMVPVGALMGIGYTLIKFYWLCCIVIPLLPIGALVGAVMLPVLFIIQKAIPECIHHFRRYKITLNELLLKNSQTSLQ